MQAAYLWPVSLKPCVFYCILFVRFAVETVFTDRQENFITYRKILAQRLFFPRARTFYPALNYALSFQICDIPANIRAGAP